MNAPAQAADELWINQEYVGHGRAPQVISDLVWRDKYAIPGEQTPGDTLRRVARALAAVETSDQDAYEELFFNAMRMGATPGGRIMANAGAEGQRGKASLINCTVSETLHDSIDGISNTHRNAMLTLSAGCGIGYDFSTLRHDGSEVAGVGARTNGPINFMGIWDSMCKTISSAGGRRGAQMGVMDIRHPDIEAFIKAKKRDAQGTPTALTQFNLSVLITADFMAAVENDSEWPLIFPMMRRGRIERPDGLIDADFPVPGPADEYWVDGSRGTVACEVVRTISARGLWELIMKSTYEFADPGFICIDRINERNPLWFCEQIRATNPCGEQPLPEYGACLLGSLDVSAFVADGEFNWQAFAHHAEVFARMLDNVCEIAQLPLEQQRHELAEKRRHGMGFLGLGSALALLKIRYGTPKAIEFTDRLSRELAAANWRTGLALAREKGPAPLLEGRTTIIGSRHLERAPGLATLYGEGDAVPNIELWLASKPIAELIPFLPEGWAQDVRKYGVRYTHATSIAPTGTIASFRDNASGGIEPSFSHVATRNVLMPGRRTRQDVEIYSAEMRRLVDSGEVDPASLPDYLVGATDVAPREHVEMQAAAQKWVDSSISKTVNVPTECPYDEFQDIYRYGYELGLKGCTTYRFNPQGGQASVLVDESEVAETKYLFTLDDGTEVELPASAHVSIDGECATALNLHMAVTQNRAFGEFENDGARAADAPEGTPHIDRPIVSADVVKPPEPPTEVPVAAAPGSDFKRAVALLSRTYKIRRPGVEGNVYVTIGIHDDGNGLRPVEMFINSADSTMEPWARGFAFAVTAILRANVDPAFLFEQIPQLRGGDYGWMGKSLLAPEGKPRHIPSVISEVIAALKLCFAEIESGMFSGAPAAPLAVAVGNGGAVAAEANGTPVAGRTCQSCFSTNMLMIEGCATCGDCGWSNCG